MPHADRFVAAFAVLPVLAAPALALGGCSGRGSAPAPTSAAPVVIAAGLLDTLARERGLGREQALNLAVEDALLARQLELADPTLAGWIEQTVLAQQLLGVLAGEARAAGPPTDAEVRELTEARFWELDRPRMVRVVHAIVLSPKEDPEARALADRIGQATRGAQTPEEFQARARAVPAEKFTVKVEALLPVTEDGRAVDPDRPPPIGPAVQHFNQVFAAAAQRLQRPGEMSPVVHTVFGYHVLYLISIVEPRQPTLDERRALLHDEIMKARAKALTTALLDRLRRELAPQQERSALASMQALGAER
ncbi:MAG TPA: peptidylprolyl isomerase [Polyangiaceae bacterium]|nr:peptidylprolyl isomerase [Polyangiaceae bacterium]